MKLLNLLMWVVQFGFSILFPTVFFLILAVWLQDKFDLGLWIVVVLGIGGSAYLRQYRPLVPESHAQGRRRKQRPQRPTRLLQ